MKTCCKASGVQTELFLYLLFLSSRQKARSIHHVRKFNDAIIPILCVPLQVQRCYYNPPPHMLRSSDHVRKSNDAITPHPTTPSVASHRPCVQVHLCASSTMLLQPTPSHHPICCVASTMCASSRMSVFHHGRL